MLSIAYALEKQIGARVGNRILHDIGNYAYPILSIQADSSFRVFFNYLLQLLRLGFWRVPLFYFYAFALLAVGRRNCDKVIGFVKRKLGRTPIVGDVYSGVARPAGGE
jgi:hypothetical protein